MKPIKITTTAHRKLFAYPRLVDGEIGGLGLVKTEGSSDFIIYDVLLFDQEVSGTHTELDESSVAQLIGELMDQKKDPSHLKLWWHSHATMRAFWSGQDIATINSFGLTAPWYVSIVVNKQGEYRARIDIYKPTRIELDELPLEVVEDDADPFVDSLRKEVSEKVNDRWRRPAGLTPFAPTKGSDVDEFWGSLGRQDSVDHQQKLFESGPPYQLPDYLKPRDTISHQEFEQMAEDQRRQEEARKQETDHPAPVEKPKEGWLARYLGIGKADE